MKLTKAMLLEVIEEELQEIIQKRGNKYCVVSKDGEKNLGCSPSKAGAKKRLGQVEYFKSIKEEDEDVSKTKQKKIAKQQKKKTARDAAKFVKAPPHFGPNASAQQTGNTIHNCAKEVIDQDREKEGIPLSKPHTEKEQNKGYAICTMTARTKGATGNKSKKYNKGSECAREGGKTPDKC